MGFHITALLGASGQINPAKPKPACDQKSLEHFPGKLADFSPRTVKAKMSNKETMAAGEGHTEIYRWTMQANEAL